MTSVLWPYWLLIALLSYGLIVLGIHDAVGNQCWKATRVVLCLAVVFGLAIGCEYWRLHRGRHLSSACIAALGSAGQKVLIKRIEIAHYTHRENMGYAQEFASVFRSVGIDAKLKAIPAAGKETRGLHFNYVSSDQEAAARVLEAAIAGCGADPSVHSEQIPPDPQHPEQPLRLLIENEYN
jgi:hypothetical protein